MEFDDSTIALREERIVSGRVIYPPTRDDIYGLSGDGRAVDIADGKERQRISKISVLESWGLRLW